jgi:Uma2 family endonuclease
MAVWFSEQNQTAIRFFIAILPPSVKSKIFEIKALILAQIFRKMGLIIKFPKPMTEDEFYKFCRQNADYRIERDRFGTVKIMDATNSEAGSYNFDLSVEVGIWNRQTQLGKAFDSSTGFTLPNTAVKSPDVSWIKKERWEALSAEERKSFAHISPDFVIELRSSKDDSLKDLKDKMVEYIENGVRMGWLLDRIEQKAYVYRADGSIEIVIDFQNGKLSGEDVMPNFELSLSLLL